MKNRDAKMKERYQQKEDDRLIKIIEKRERMEKERYVREKERHLNDKERYEAEAFARPKELAERCGE